MKKARRLSNNRLLEAIKTILSHHRTFPSRRQTTRQAAMRALDNRGFSFSPKSQFF